MNALVLSSHVPREWANAAEARAQSAEAERRDAFREADEAWEAAARHGFLRMIGHLDTDALREMLVRRLAMSVMRVDAARVLADPHSRSELMEILTDMFLFDTTESL